jgi:hypothetical protein
MDLIGEGVAAAKVLYYVTNRMQHNALQHHAQQLLQYTPVRHGPAMWGLAAKSYNGVTYMMQYNAPCTAAAAVHTCMPWTC